MKGSKFIGNTDPCVPRAYLTVNSSRAMSGTLRTSVLIEIRPLDKEKIIPSICKYMPRRAVYLRS